MRESWKEFWGIAWLHFRSPTRVNIDASSVTLNGSKVHPTSFQSIGEQERGWLLSKLKLSKLSISFASDGQCQSLVFVGTNENVESLRVSLTAFVTGRLAALLQSYATQTTSLESAKSTIYSWPSYVRHSHAKEFADKHKQALHGLEKEMAWFAEAGMLTDVQRSSVAALSARVGAVRPYADDWEAARTTHNNWFIDHFSREEADYFKTVESSPLTPEQVRSCLVFEDATLVVAAAGSGKSSSIVGKIGFALKAGLFRDDEVLALAYNKEAAESLKERLRGKLSGALNRDVNVTSRTFHGFGLATLVQLHGKGYEPRVLKEDGGEENRFIKDVIADLFKNSPDFQIALSDWILKAAYEDPQPVGTSDDLDECAKRYEECCRARIRARRESERKVYEPSIPTFNSSIYVRSLQERGIANWLLLHGIPFQYEEADWDGAKRLRRPTKTGGKRRPLIPDFTYRITKTLPDKSTVTLRIVHEHFALGPDGTAPDWIGGQKYVDHANDKRKMYTAWARESERSSVERIRFIETHSAHFYDGTVFERLRALLAAEGVVVGPPLDAVKDKALTSFRESGELEKLIIDFVLSFKESGCQKADIVARASASPQPYRASLFLKVAFYVFDAYQRALRERHKIDYADMLREAITVLSNKSVKVPYRFILVDEFQDISRLRADLVKAVLDQAPGKSIVFCVGDDWQTINRFSGSDVAIFTGIGKYFGRYTERVDLPKTFRCAQGIADVSRKVVMRNAGQFDKKVRSHNPVVEKTVRVIEHGSEPTDRSDALIRELDRIALEGPVIKANLARLLGRPGPDKADVPSVLILRRTQHEVTAPQGLDDEFLDSLATRYRGRLSISRMSAHGAKGLEADFAILPGLDSGFQGFPDERPPEWILDLVLPRMKDLVEEERRLFYVGLTRARFQAIVLTAAEKPSEFILELASLRGANGAIEWITFDEAQRTPCPVCQKGSLVIRRPKGTRRSCTRSVRCGYRESASADAAGKLRSL